MSKHAKTNVVTKVLGYTTVAIVAGTAVATFLPSSYYSGAPLSDSANIVSSVEQMVSFSPTPAAVTPSPKSAPARATTVKTKTASTTATSTQKITAAQKTSTSTETAAP